MEAGAMPRRMMEGRLFTGRRKGRPRLRWMDDVLADWAQWEYNGGRRRQRIGSSGDWLSRRPRLTQGCSAEWMDGWMVDGRWVDGNGWILKRTKHKQWSSRPLECLWTECCVVRKYQHRRTVPVNIAC
jgi:hypothetical protein